MNDIFPSDYEKLIYVRTYSKWVDELKRRENWEETIKRYNDFFNKKIPKNKTKEFNDVCKSIENLEVMPSMRSLWTAGKALDRENIAGYNCATLVVDSIKAFAELLYILMNGCFEKDTLIKTKNGDKKISELTEKDEILTYNINKDEFEYNFPLFVTETPDTNKKPKIELEFEDGSIIKCTEDHEFYTTNRGWVKAKDLDESDDIKNCFNK